MKLGEMAVGMKKRGKHRIRSLTAETATSMWHVCNGFVDLARYLLNAGNEYVILGWFTTDPLERCFGKLRQGSGGTYFITVESAIEKIRIQREKYAKKTNARLLIT